MTALAPQQALTTFNVLDDWRDSVISMVESLDEDQLITFIQESHRLAENAFVVRGVLAAEAVSRAKDRGEEVGKTLSAVAKDAGVSKSTLDYDCRIIHEFGLDELRSHTALDREFYRLALAAPDPQDTVEFFKSQKANGAPLSTRDARTHVERLNAGEDKEVVESEHWAKVIFTPEAWKALHEAQKYLDMSTSEIVGKLLLEWQEFHASR
jgi:hypothetical protein